MGLEQSQVRKIETNLIRLPEDEAASEEKLVSGRGELTEGTGAGGSVTGTAIVSAPSGGVYVHMITSALFSYSDDVYYQFIARDASGTAQDTRHANPSGAPFTFDPPIKLREDWSFDVVMHNSTGASETVRYTVLARGDTSVRNIDVEKSPTVTTSVYEDFERATPLSDYTGATGDYSVVDVSGDKWLETTGSAGVIVSSGLAGVPAEGDTFSTTIWAEEGTETLTTGYVHVLFGVTDASNYYDINLSLHNDDIVLATVDGGVRNDFAWSDLDSFSAQDEITLECDWEAGSQFTVEVFQSGNFMGQVSGSDDANTFSSGQIGFDASVDAGVTVRYDDGGII